MVGAKDEERLLPPLFPRLHLNGTEKGISRLPPKNKISLYGQLYLPAQGFSSDSLPFYPLPSPSASSTHVENSEKSILWQHWNSHESSTWVGLGQKRHSFNSSNGMKVNITEGTHEHKSLNSVDPIPSIPRPLRSQNFSYLKNFMGEDMGDQHCQQDGDWEIDSEAEDSKPSLHLQTVHENEGEGIDFPNPKSRHSVKSKLQDFGEENKCKLGHASCGLEKTREHWGRAYENEAHEKMGFCYTKLVETRKKNCASGVRSEACQSLPLGLDCEEEMKCRSLQAKGVSPMDVVRVLGEKHFQEVGRSIMNHQKLFAHQVFELHRLAKVQKLIAESPSILLEDGHSSRKPSLEVASKLFLDQNSLRPFIIETDNNELSRKPNNPFIEGDDEHVVPKLLPCLNKGTARGLWDQHLKYAPYSTTASRPLQMNLGSSSWCFQPTGTQWLVPVMSPSEGLIYKPYTAASGVAAEHGFGIPLGNSPSLGQTYFPIYGMPVQGSAALKSSSPFERAGGDALPLFPMEPIYAQNFEAREHHTEVIKVVPHNPRLPCEPATQFFQSIQGEKKEPD